MNKMRIRSLISGMVASAAVALVGDVAIAQRIQEDSGAKDVSAAAVSSKQARAELAARLAQTNMLKKGGTNVKSSADRAAKIAEELSDDQVMSALSKSSHAELEAAIFGSQAARDLLSSLVEKGTSVAGIIKALGSSNADLTFTPLVPCRILDTRVAIGPLTANTGRPYDIDAADITAQGGVASGGCGIPTAARALSVNITVIGAGTGYLFHWPDLSPIPNASILNFSPATGGPIANAAVLSILPSNPAAHLMVQPAGTTGTHVIMDVLGYFAPPFTTALSCVELYTATTDTIATNATLCRDAPACTAGYTAVSVLTKWISGGPASLVQVQPDPSASFFSACWVNERPTTAGVQVGVRCCRVPGR